MNRTSSLETWLIYRIFPGTSWCGSLASDIGRLRERSFTLGSPVLINAFNDVVWSSKPSNSCLCLGNQTSKCRLSKEVHMTVVCIENYALLCC